jgi:hypothetical protein
MTYYEVLEIDPRASTGEVERAYRRVARKVHPDLNAGDRGRAEARMKLLNEIRDTLTDPLLRAGYDERLRLETQRRESASPPPRDAPRTPREPAPAAPPRDTSRDTSSVGAQAPSGSVWVALPLVALGGGVMALALLSSPRLAKHLPDPFASASVNADAGLSTDVAPLLTTPVSASSRLAPEPPDHPARGRVRGRGVVHLGSSADDVLRVLGPPDRYEPGRHPGEAVLRYGRLRLEMRNGRVVGGDAAVR